MKLAFSPASPYVRKVMACAVARGIDGQQVCREVEALGRRSGAGRAHAVSPRGQMRTARAVRGPPMAL